MALTPAVSHELRDHQSRLHQVRPTPVQPPLESSAGQEEGLTAPSPVQTPTHRMLFSCDDALPSNQKYQDRTAVEQWLKSMEDCSCTCSTNQQCTLATSWQPCNCHKWPQLQHKSTTMLGVPPPHKRQAGVVREGLPPGQEGLPPPAFVILGLLGKQ